LDVSGAGLTTTGATEITVRVADAHPETADQEINKSPFPPVADEDEPPLPIPV